MRTTQYNIMKLLLLLFTSIFFQTTLAATDLPTPTTVTQNLDGIAAVVNNDVITQSELESAIAKAKAQMTPEQASHLTDAQLQKMLLQQLIDEKLQLEMAKRANITISAAQLNQAIEHVANANHLTLSQLKAKLSAQGISFAAYQSAVHKQMLIHQVQMSAIGHTINVTDKDIQSYLDKYQSQMAHARQYHVLNLLIPTDSTDKAVLEKAKQKAASMEAQWKKGKNPDPNNTTDLGWQTIDTLPTVFLDQLQHMKAGDISAPIQAPNGYHIIKLVAVKNDTQNMPSKAELQEAVYQMKFEKAAEEWLKKIRESAYIHINQP